MKQELVKTRKRIIKEKNFKLLEIFDSLEKTSGEKDVSLCQTPEGQLVILRIGEIHPKSFFPNGYIGKNLVIPKLYESHSQHVIYEIEEFLQGKMICEMDMKNHLLGKVDEKLLNKLFAAFWEFQIIARDIKLKNKSKKQNLLDHFKLASPLLKSPEQIKNIFIKNKKFWNELYPSKWKFATDNLIMLENNKIAFIDNVNAGLRYFGYDLGWIIWPRWVEMKTAKFSQVNEQLDYLNNFLFLVKKTKPKKIKINNLDKKFWLMIMDRLIGAIYDVARDVRHLAHWGMGPTDNKTRKEKHLKFLNSLLEEVIKKV